MANYTLKAEMAEKPTKNSNECALCSNIKRINVRMLFNFIKPHGFLQTNVLMQICEKHTVQEIDAILKSDENWKQLQMLCAKNNGLKFPDKKTSGVIFQKIKQ